MRLETDLAGIRRIAEQKDEENLRFRSFLKAYDGPDGRIDALVHDFYRKVSSEIDCRQCSNCCRTIQPELSHEDVHVFAAGLNLPVDKFRGQYLARGEEPASGGSEGGPVLFWQAISAPTTSTGPRIAGPTPICTRRISSADCGTSSRIAPSAP